MDRYRNRWKDNHVDLSELKIYCIVVHGCRKPALIVLLTLSKVLLGSVGRVNRVNQFRKLSVVIVLMWDVNHHHDCGRSFCNKNC